MNSEIQNIWQFGDFRLDTDRKVLWHQEKTVAMPLKELELLSMLVRQRGELVTKDELLGEIWEDSFVEESNLSRHIYLLRKTLKELGADGLIENVPRRGYRFTGAASACEVDAVVIERHTRTRTKIEFEDQKDVAKIGSSTRRGLFVFACVLVLAAGGAALFGLRYIGSAGASGPVRSLAVMPFKTIGTGNETSQSGAGLADILTTRLSSIRNVKISSVSAVHGLEGLAAVDVGTKLQVDAVLEGTIYRSGDRVRVTARLLRISDASIMWAGEFEKLSRDEMHLQKELALQIVPALAVNLSGREREALGRTYTENPDAYQLYVRGRYEWNKRNTSGIIEAQRLFRNAVAADPGFALAYVGLADSLVMNQSQAGEAPVMIAKALELDPDLGEAYATRGFYEMFFGWEWQKAEESFKRSLELNPNYATAHHWYATLLAIRGDTAAARNEMHQALELNPLSHNFLADLGQLHYFSGDYEEAEKYCLKALQIDPDFSFAHEYLHNIYLKTGRYEEAVVEFAKADAINGTYTREVQKIDEPVRRFRAALHESGINGYLELRFPGTPTSPESFYLYAMKHALIGDSEKALDYLEKSADAHMFLSAFVKAEPAFEQLRTEPRYQRILIKMGLG